MYKNIDYIIFKMKSMFDILTIIKIKITHECDDLRIICSPFLYIIIEIIKKIKDIV